MDFFGPKRQPRNQSRIWPSQGDGLENFGDFNCTYLEGLVLGFDIIEFDCLCLRDPFFTSRSQCKFRSRNSTCSQCGKWEVFSIAAWYDVDTFYEYCGWCELGACDLSLERYSRRLGIVLPLLRALTKMPQNPVTLFMCVCVIFLCDQWTSPYFSRAFKGWTPDLAFEWRGKRLLNTAWLPTWSTKRPDETGSHLD